MAAIDYTYVSQTTLQTHTGDTSFTDISGASISSGSFIANKKYLMLIFAQVSGNNGDAEFTFEVVRGSTPTRLVGSVLGIEPSSTQSSTCTYAFMTVFTAPDPVEEVKMRFRNRDNNGDTVSADQISMFVMNISDDLIENTDWFSNANTSDTELSTTFADFAKITFTPGTAGEDWLIIFNANIDNNETNRNTETRLDRSGEATSTTPLISQEGEDSSEQQLHFGMRAFNLGNSENIFKVQCREDASANAQHEGSRIFAINLDKFKQHEVKYKASTVYGTASSWVTEIDSSVGITPSPTSDVIAMSFLVVNFDSAAVNVFTRQQVNNTDQPGTQTADRYNSPENWDQEDQQAWCKLAVITSQSSLQDLDIDGDADTSGVDALDSQIVLFTAELANGAPPAPTLRNLTLTGVGQ